MGNLDRGHRAGSVLRALSSRARTMGAEAFWWQHADCRPGSSADGSNASCSEFGMGFIQARLELAGRLCRADVAPRGSQKPSPNCPMAADGASGKKSGSLAVFSNTRSFRRVAASSAECLHAARDKEGVHG